MKSTGGTVGEVRIGASQQKQRFLSACSTSVDSQNPHPVAEDATRVGHPEVGTDNQCL